MLFQLFFLQDEKTQLDELRGMPMAVGTLEEIIDDNHGIVSTSSGPEHYVGIMSFVDKDAIEPGCTVLLHNKVCREVVGARVQVVDRSSRAAGAKHGEKMPRARV